MLPRTPALLLLAFAASFSAADVFTTFPFSTSTIPAGTPTTITWREGTAAPPFSEIQSLKIDLCTGSDLAQVCPLVLANRVDPHAGKLDITIPANIGPSGPVWFLRYTTDKGVANWSTRFTVTGASGPAPVAGAAPTVMAPVTAPVAGGNANANANATTPAPGAGNATMPVNGTLPDNSTTGNGSNGTGNRTSNSAADAAARVGVVTALSAVVGAAAVGLW